MDDRTGVLGALSEDFYNMFVGAEAELRFFDILTWMPMPPWFLGFREADYEEDYAGADCIVYTDVGEARVQVKRSFAEAKKFVWRSPRSGIIVIVVPPYMTDAQVHAEIIIGLAKWRTARQQRMRRWRLIWAPIALYSSRA